MPQRPIERTRWVRFAYVCDVNNLTIAVRRGVLQPDEVNAACNATIIIDRMLRHNRQRGKP